MIDILLKITQREKAHIILALAALVLLIDPIIWLWITWYDPAYASEGGYIAMLCLGLVVWSVRSPLITLQPISTHYGWGLLGATFILRIIGQMLAINVIGALALVVDVYAVAYLCRVHQRQYALSPFWLAICFAFCLPLESIVQRSIGYGLQHISAFFACGILSALFAEVECYGVRLIVSGKEALVDLPCSGAKSLLLLGLGYSICAAVCRFSWQRAIWGAMVMLCVAVMVNSLRIVMLAIGIAHPHWLGGIDVMDEPWHGGIGLICLLLGMIPLLLLAKKGYRPVQKYHRFIEQLLWVVPDVIMRDGQWWADAPSRKKISSHSVSLCAIGVLACALMVVNLPRKALDVSGVVQQGVLPLMLQGEYAEVQPLLPQEQDYFMQYGGSAKKARYGNAHLMVVQTTSPLRHLHSPEACLRGQGFAVRYLGMRYAPFPSALYRAISPTGEAYQIAASFVADDGFITSNVSEAVWHWLQHPQSHWQAIQRIIPESETYKPTDYLAFDRAVQAAFDLSQPTYYSHLTYRKGTKNE